MLSRFHGPDSDATNSIAYSLVTFDVGSRLLATVDVTMPNVVWIWAISEPMLTAVIVQTLPVKRLSWHPSIQGILLILSHQDDSAHFSIWRDNHHQPLALTLPARKCDVWWAHDTKNSHIMLLARDLGTSSAYVVWPFGKQHSAGSDEPDESNDMTWDSVDEALLGNGPGSHNNSIGRLDDTFDVKSRVSSH